MGAPASRTPHQPTRAAAAEQPGAWSQSNQPQPHRAATSTLTKSHDMHTHMTDCCSHESLVWPGGAAGSPPGHTLPPAPHCRGSLLPPPLPRMGTQQSWHTTSWSGGPWQHHIHTAGRGERGRQAYRHSTPVLCPDMIICAAGRPPLMRVVPPTVNSAGCFFAPPPQAEVAPGYTSKASWCATSQDFQAQLCGLVLTPSKPTSLPGDLLVHHCGPLDSIHS